MQNLNEPTKIVNTENFVYRVDKFIVPEGGKAEFLQAVKKTHLLLRNLLGFRQDFILEQTSGSGKYNFVTIVEWENTNYLQKAINEIKSIQERENFHPSEIMNKHGIKGDFSFSRQILF